MKNLLLALSLTLVAPLAEASSMQETCSNSDASVRTSGGHGPFFTEITRRDWKNGTNTVIRDEEGTLNVEELSNQTIKQESHEGACRNGMRAPWYRHVYSREVRITNADGSRFEEGTLHANRDYTAVETLLVCERTVSNIVPCQK